MKTARLLSTVAAAVLLTAGVASAQGTKQDQPPGAAAPPAAQQKAPAEKVAPPMHNGQKADQNKASQNKTVKPSETTGQAPKSSDMDKSKSSDMDKPPAAKKDADSKRPADSNNVELKGKTESDRTLKSTDSNKTGASGSSTQSTETNKTSASGTATTGQGPASAAKLSTEQRTKITTIIKQQKVERVEPARLNVSVRVGTRVPDSVRFYPLPVEVIAIYPEWRGYDYILVGDEILVIDPRTHEIVAILEA